MSKKVSYLVMAILFGFCIVGAAQISYQEFYRQSVTSMAKETEHDANSLDQILDSWGNGEIAQSAVVEKLKQMEVKAESYFEKILKLQAPEGKFKEHKQTVYVFVTWSTIIGMFTEGMADLDLAKLDSAVTLTDYFDRKVDEFDQKILEESESN